MSYNSAVKKLRRRLIYQTNAMKLLMESEEGKRLHLFQDLYENSERYSSLCHLYQELMTDLINGYMSLSTHKLNGIMKVLTIVTVIFMPLTLMVGIYGMNFQHMPELTWHYGYFAVLGVMGLLSIALMAVFRYLRWL
jgi:magnesium transporter